MKAGFWVAPEGADAPIAMLPIGGPDLSGRKASTTGTGALSFLATTGADEMIARCPRVAALLPKLADALDAQRAAAVGTVFDLSSLGPEEIALVGEVFGEGEVAATVALPDGVVAQVQESVLAGLWRVRFTDASGLLVADYAEVSAIPQAVRRAAAMTLPNVAIGTPPDGAMNVMPVLAEIRDRVAGRQPGDPSHTIALSLFPMTPEDVDFLQAALGTGPVRIVSRGYGTCRIQATAIHDVWSVQFFNAMDTILLDTLEIGDVPVVACAAEEDFRDSAERLREIEEAYFK
jgi:hydrogenase-1 operon protein HyaF